MRVVRSVGQDDIGLEPRLQLIDPGLYVCTLVREEPIAELGELDLAARGSGQKRSCAELRPGGAAAGRTDHAPVAPKMNARGDPAENGPARTDLDIVGVRAQAKNRQAVAGARKREALHRAVIARPRRLC